MKRKVFLITALLALLVLSVQALALASEGVVVFADDMENGVNGWTVTGSGSLWHQSQRRANSPTTAWYFGLEDQGNLNTGIGGEFGRLHSPSINLTEATVATLTFYEWNELGVGMDARVGIQTDQMFFPETVFISGNTNGQWVQRTVDISAFVGQGNVSIKFDFLNCGSFGSCDMNFEGWFIDDVQVTADTTSNSLPEPEDVVEITRAEYRQSKQQLEVRATSTGAPTANLGVFVTATNEFIGTLTHTGGDEYRGTFSWPVNPQNITVRSSLGGSATRAVTLK